MMYVGGGAGGGTVKVGASDAGTALPADSGDCAPGDDSADEGLGEAEVLVAEAGEDACVLLLAATVPGGASSDESELIVDNFTRCFTGVTVGSGEGGDSTADLAGTAVLLE